MVVLILYSEGNREILESALRVALSLPRAEYISIVNALNVGQAQGGVDYEAPQMFLNFRIDMLRQRFNIIGQVRQRIGIYNVTFRHTTEKLH